MNIQEIIEKTDIDNEQQAMMDLTIEKCCIDNPSARLAVRTMCEALFVIGVHKGIKITDELYNGAKGK